MESARKEIARERDRDGGASFSVEWEQEWAFLWQRVLRTRRYPGTTKGIYWKVEIDAHWERVEQRWHGGGGAPQDRMTRRCSGNMHGEEVAAAVPVRIVFSLAVRIPYEVVLYTYVNVCNLLII